MLLIDIKKITIKLVFLMITVTLMIYFILLKIILMMKMQGLQILYLKSIYLDMKVLELIKKAKKQIL